jgi:hypothetical protein
MFSFLFFFEKKGNAEFFISIFFLIWIGLHDIFCFGFCWINLFQFFYMVFYHLSFYKSKPHYYRLSILSSYINAPPLFSPPLKITLAIQIFRVVLLVVDIFGPFVEFLFVFNFILQSRFIMYFFRFVPYSFDFYFFLVFFMNFLFVFNFILQFNFMIYYFFNLFLIRLIFSN